MVALAPSPVSQPFGDLMPSGRAAEIVRGVQRMFAELGLASLTEVTLANGRRADVMAVGAKGEIAIVEVKSCLADFQTDQKWPEYAPYCDRFYFAVDCDFPKERIPEHAGLMVCDGFGGAVLRECQPELLNAARRKAVTLSFARLAAARLMRTGVAPGASSSEPAID
ncbi:MAG: MmcB family DNA repair protein [Hyphomonadaceae bacterium]